MSTASNTQPDSTPTEPNGIPIYERFMLWMFVTAFILFGFILVGDLLMGLMR